MSTQSTYREVALTLDDIPIAEGRVPPLSSVPLSGVRLVRSYLTSIANKRAFYVGLQGRG